MDNFCRLLIGDGQQQFFIPASSIFNAFSSRAQFARRDAVYYQSLSVKAQDAFVIICTITSSPAKPSSLQPRQPVPKSLLDTVGSLLDDPLYSDVCFAIPGRDQSIQNSRTIWASKRLLQRAEYFRTSRVYLFYYEIFLIQTFA